MKLLRLVLVALVALVASSGSGLLATGSPVSGTWATPKKVQPPVGMELLATGPTLTGAVHIGDSPAFAISDGRVDGDRIVFKAMIVEEGGDSYPMTFSGRLSGNRIKFKCEVETNVPGEKTQLGPACLQSITVARVKER